MKKNEHYKYINEHVIVYKFLHVLDRDCFVLIVTLLDTLYKICIQRYIKFKKKNGIKIIYLNYKTSAGFNFKLILLYIM